MKSRTSWEMLTALATAGFGTGDDVTTTAGAAETWDVTLVAVAVPLVLTADGGVAAYVWNAVKADMGSVTLAAEVVVAASTAGEAALMAPALGSEATNA